MSFKLVVAVRDHSVVRTPGQFSVLITLATYARNDGSCWCAVENLMNHTRLARRGVQTILRQLENFGLIKPLTNGRGGRGKATRYRIQLPAEEMTEEPKNVKSLENSALAAPFNNDKERTECTVLLHEKGALSAQKGAASAPDISSQRKISECVWDTHTVTASAVTQTNVRTPKKVRTPKNVRTRAPQNVQPDKKVQSAEDVQTEENLVPSLPEISEVIAYCAKLGLPATDAKYLHDHWLSNGFKKNGEPIADWQAAIRARKARNFLPSLEQVRKQAAKSKTCMY
jgi:hypothetical protein